MSDGWVPPMPREPAICSGCGGAIPSVLHEVSHEKPSCTIDGCPVNAMKGRRYCRRHEDTPARRRRELATAEGVLTQADRDYARQARRG